MIIIYKYLGIILIPLIKINLLLRILKGKENKNRFSERYGISSIERPEGDLIWIHAASVGEFKSTVLLIDTLHKKYTILLTTTTLSAANYAIKNYGHKIIHQFAPLDISIWVEKFLIKWRPKLVIWIESDLWPITTKLLNSNRTWSRPASFRYRSWIRSSASAAERRRPVKKRTRLSRRSV